MPDNKIAPAPPEGTTEVVLSAFESNGFGGLLGEGITTVTFFKGDLQNAASFLRERLAQVAAANPWIFGNLVKEKQHGKRCALRFSTKPPAVTDDVFAVRRFVLSDDTEYGLFVKRVNASGAKIPSGRKLLNKPLPVCKLTLCRAYAVDDVRTTQGETAADADGGFALIFSMSHVVCNGGTYYQLLNMLSADGEVVAMNPTRQEALQDKVYEYMGRKEYAFLNGAANMCNALRKVFFGKNPKAYCFLVDDAKLSEAKAAAKAKPDAPDRISANDVLTSAYGKVCQSSLLIMACDFKGRIEGTSATDAAQYHAALLLDADGYGSPASIRKALMGPPPLSRAALPTFWKAQGSRLGLITSWAALKSLSIPSCQLTLHTPCEQTSGLVVKAQDDTCIVFNPKPGKLAMLCMTTKLSPDELMAALPFEGPLNPFMWEHG